MPCVALINTGDVRECILHPEACVLQTSLRSEYITTVFSLKRGIASKPESSSLLNGLERPPDWYRYYGNRVPDARSWSNFIS